jgi:hypothetical protein
MIGIAISIVTAEISAGVASVIGGGTTPPPPPIEDRYILDGGTASTTAFSGVIDGGSASTTTFVIDYSGETA